MILRGSIEFTITEHSADRVVSEMPVTAGIKNPFGGVHAGAMLWLADVTATRLVLGDRQMPAPPPPPPALPPPPSPAPASG